MLQMCVLGRLLSKVLNCVRGSRCVFFAQFCGLGSTNAIVGQCWLPVAATCDLVRARFVAALVLVFTTLHGAQSAENISLSSNTVLAVFPDSPQPAIVGKELGLIGEHCNEMHHLILGAIGIYATNSTEVIK